MSKKNPADTAQAIRLAPELVEPLKEFAGRCDLSLTHVVRAGLGFLLPKLAKGELAIVNGELRETRKAA